jgi:hypothetical protein
MAAGTVSAAVGASRLLTGNDKAQSIQPARPTSVTSVPPTSAAPPPSLPPLVPSTAGPPVEAAPGTGRPPQFVVVSFDGSADNQLLAHWRELATKTGAHFSFFLSGAYLLLRPNAKIYLPPRHGPGTSDIGFFPVPAGADPGAELTTLIEQLGTAIRDGHELGTHYNGHFCGRSPRAVGAWSADDWRSELDQFQALLGNVGSNNGLGQVKMPFGLRGIIGGRTPCLEGNLGVLYSVLQANGFRYDASTTAAQGAWPKQKSGLWSFPLHSIPLSGRKFKVLAMDYNLYYNQSGAKPAPPNQVPVIRGQTLDTYRRYFVESYTGNRAPMSLGHHFTRWNGGAYIDALTQWITEVAAIPEVRLVNYRTLVDWLDQRTPEELARFSAGHFERSPKIPVAYPPA